MHPIMPRQLKALNQVLAQSSLGDKHRQRSLLLLSKICKTNSIVPASYVLQEELIRVGKFRCHGGHADVSEGEYLGSPVAIKCFKISEEGYEGIFKVPSIGLARNDYSAFTQKFCQEVIGWKHLSHPNIQPLFGVSVSPDPRRFRILTEWMPNGNVTQYTRSNPEANRLQLVGPLVISLGFISPIHRAPLAL